MSEQVAKHLPMRTPAQLVEEWRKQTNYTPGDLYSDGRATAFARCADELELSLKTHPAASHPLDTGLVEAAARHFQHPTIQPRVRLTAEEAAELARDDEQALDTGEALKDE